MSTIRSYDVAAAIQDYGIRRFVETGTGTGESLTIATTYPFVSLWSCEIITSLLMEVQQQINDARVELFAGSSVDMLAQLPNLPSDEPILFWLDAHFPGADYGLRSYDAETDDSLRLPLESELALISMHRPRAADVIVIDDARIWLDLPFQNGSILPEFQTKLGCPLDRNIGFISEKFAMTHQITVLCDNEGLIILTPKI